MTKKLAGKGDYAVSKLEAQYRCEGVEGDFSSTPKEEWRWKLLIRTPDFITGRDLHEAVAALDKRGKKGLAEEVRMETIDEGRCVQMLHMGPYEREKETIDQMIAFAAAGGYSAHGRHHEIYLSDPRRVPPERLKTILRFPVQKRSST
jgi:hypothetical protein